MVKPIHVLNGPNLNLLGTREPEIYGKDTLDDVRTRCEARAAAWGLSVVFRQSNHEGVLIDWVQEARTEACALVINPAGYGHTSIALLDALKTLNIRSSSVTCRTRRRVRISAATPSFRSRRPGSSPALARRAMNWRSRPQSA
jgi:3-dehydroquinate dehydratase